MFSADGRKGTPPAAARGLAHVARGARALEAVARVANALLLREVASALTKRDSESEMRLVCVIRCAAGARSLVRGKRRCLRPATCTRLPRVLRCATCPDASLHWPGQPGISNVAVVVNAKLQAKGSGPPGIGILPCGSNLNG